MEAHRGPRGPLTWMLPEEVITHNVPGDVWVTVLGRVLDVSDLADPLGTLASRVLIAFAGKDMSLYFDPDTLDVATFIHPSSGEEIPLLAPLEEGKSWWREPSRVRGWLTKRARPVRILDTFSGTQTCLTVCSEDSVGRVLQRYQVFNSGAADRYSCVSEDGEGVVGLDPTRTLDENGVVDERDLYIQLGLPEDFYVPALQLILRHDDDDGPSNWESPAAH